MLTFTTERRRVLERVTESVKAGGKLVFHEYFDYWLSTFIEIGRRRLVELGCMSAEDAEAIWRAATAAQTRWMFTPGVLEIIARRS